MKNQEPQWDKIEYTLMDVLQGAVGQLKSEYLTKIMEAQTEAEKNWWTAYFIGFDHLTDMVDSTNADEINETISLITSKLRELKASRTQ